MLVTEVSIAAQSTEIIVLLGDLALTGAELLFKIVDPFSLPVLRRLSKNEKEEDTDDTESATNQGELFLENTEGGSKERHEVLLWRGCG